MLEKQKQLSLKKDKNGFNPVSFTDTQLNFGEVLVETNPQHTSWALTDYANCCLFCFNKIFMK